MSSINVLTKLVGCFDALDASHFFVDRILTIFSAVQTLIPVFCRNQKVDYEESAGLFIKLCVFVSVTVIPRAFIKVLYVDANTHCFLPFFADVQTH